MSRATSIQKVLDDLYPNPPAPLDHCNDFTFLVAVILSAQTTDGAVNSVTKELFRLAPEPVLLAKMPHAQVLKIIQTVGLAPKKSQYIIDTAKALVEKFGGRVPSTLEELITLPGVGRKTAAVVLSQIHGVPALAVDTHVHRLALRWGITKDEKRPEIAQKDLCEFFPITSWNRIHLQMIYFGREYCTAKGHVPSACPICSWVNKGDSSRPPKSYSSYLPKTPPKGIVFYADRVKEIAAFSDQQRAQYSPVKPHVLKMMESPKDERRDLFGGSEESSQPSTTGTNKKRKIFTAAKNCRETTDKKAQRKC